MDSIELNAPAKINLLLDIVGILPNGYHDMQMIMQSISLYDKIRIMKNKMNKVNIFCDDYRVPTNMTNTAFKAAMSFFEKCNITDFGVNISIKKNIPSQSGMGGGSADAAAVLIGLNKLFNTNMTSSQLADIGKEIGADIPFCIYGGTALVQGIGEKVILLAPLPHCYIAIAKPKKGVCTKHAFAKFDSLASCEHPNIKLLIDEIANADINKVAKSMGHVLEAVCDVQEVFKIKEEMTSMGAIGAMMSGSGSTVFGIFNDESKAKACVNSLSNTYFTALTSPVKAYNNV
ncbi:MAG: 4-(cytidine 5'-diphospho)-2-C-methyl-D-erythritol kinase [Oscillospiraceae bacterium]